ncbi:hypothetical protein AgCh_009303 [Apium graveolens]
MDKAWMMLAGKVSRGSAVGKAGPISRGKASSSGVLKTCNMVKNRNLIDIDSDNISLDDLTLGSQLTDKLTIRNDLNMSLNKYESIKIPMLKKTEYPTWNVKMIMHLEATDPVYLDVINDGPYMPTKLVRATPTFAEHYQLKENSEWTPEEKVDVLKDAKFVGVIRKKNNLPELDTDDSSSNLDDDSDSEVDENMTDSDVMQMTALLVKCFRRMQFRKSKNNKSLRKNFTRGERKSIGRKDGNDSKAGKVDRTRIKCYNCDEPGHFSTECKKSKYDKGKNKALITSSKNWMDSSDSDNEDTCYALMASLNDPASSESKIDSKKEYERAKHTVKILEARYSMLEIDLENERKTLKAWTDSGKKVHEMISKKNWKECLGYKDGVKDVDTENKISLKTPIKFIPSEDDEPKSTLEKGSTSVSQEKLVSNKSQRKESKETIKTVKREKNIGLLSARQLKKKIYEVTDKPQIKSPKRNRNGKQGISKDSNYKVVPNAPRKTCFNCGNTNHLAIDCRRSK